LIPTRPTKSYQRNVDIQEHEQALVCELFKVIGDCLETKTKEGMQLKQLRESWESRMALKDKALLADKSVLDYLDSRHR